MICRICGSTIRIIGTIENKQLVGMKQCTNEECPNNEPTRILIGELEVKT